MSRAGLGYGGDGGNEPTGPCITTIGNKGTVESHRYYLARRTVLEMLRDRGCVVLDSDINRSLADFRSKFGNKPDVQSLRITAPLGSNPSKKIFVIFCGTDEIRKQVMRGILSQIVSTDSLHRVILILQSKMNYHARKLADDFQVKIETFHITDMLANFTKHLSEPKHEILTAEEKTVLLKKYNVDEKKLPRMLEDDAIARYYGLEKGQVVKVSYSGAITNSLVNYRCVV